jgi:mono/diheme cytochrome c family protein
VKPLIDQIFPNFTVRTLLPLLAVAVVAVSAAACAVQESNTYPIEIFSEMHYSQSTRMQEPPRLAPVADAVPFQQIGTEQVLTVPERLERPYDAARARELYRINCSTCHGMSGTGDGPAAQHITATDSYWAQTNDSPYVGPADLFEKRATYDQEAMINLVSNGIVVMPRFRNLLAEEDIREIVAYVYDQNTGVGQ